MAAQKRARTMWIVRAGEKNRHDRLFETMGAVAVGWNDVPGLGDLTGLTDTEIETLVRAAKPDADVEAERGRLVKFRDDLRPGDGVITVTQGSEIVLGEITGGYEHRTTPVGDYRHVRTVDWFGAMPRADLADDLRKDTNLRPALRELHERREVWLQLVDAAKAGARPLRAPGALPGRRKAAAGSGGRAPAASTVVERRCPGCQMSKLPAQFIAGSELCVDCRS